MKVIRGIAQLEDVPLRTVVTIGNFDGVHKGHQQIIATAVEKAKARNGASVAYTFRPHPQIALNPDSKLQLLLTYDEKLAILESLGLDYVIEEPFSREFSTIQPEKFFSEYLLRRLNTEAIVVGYDFAFGRGRKGHLDLLKDFCERSGVELTVIEPQRFDGEVASSSRVRQHLLAGRVAEANSLLGREFFYRGVVVKGEGRGRKIGFPTANLQPGSKLTLPYGVYATCTKVIEPGANYSGNFSSGQTYSSVTNIGVRPTFQKSASGSQSDDTFPVLIETHLIDQNIDLYGRVLEVRFLDRIRPEKKFSGVEELKNQIAKDVELARGLLDIKCHSAEN